MVLCMSSEVGDSNVISSGTGVESTQHLWWYAGLDPEGGGGGGGAGGVHPPLDRNSI